MTETNNDAVERLSRALEKEVLLSKQRDAERHEKIREEYAKIRCAARRLRCFTEYDETERNLDALEGLRPLPYCHEITVDVLNNWLRCAFLDGLLTMGEMTAAMARLSAGIDEIMRRRFAKSENGLRF